MARKAIIIFACVLALAGTWWVFKSESPLDLSKEDEPLRSMVLPVQRVEGDCSYNTVSVRVFDATGNRFSFLFYRDEFDPWTEYPCFLNIWTGKAVRSPKRSAVISRLIKESKNRDEGSVIAMERLSRRPSDPAARIVRKVKNFLEGPERVD